MSLARIVFLQKKLREKYGVEGYVAGLYLEAGYSVEVGFATGEGRVAVKAVKGGEVLAVDVLTEKKVYGVEAVEAIARKAKSIGAKPVLVLYGSGPRLSKEALEKARELGVRVRRVRPPRGERP